MATTAKSQKDKTRAGKLAPRPTAASAARAAHNALNRNIEQPSKILLSPCASEKRAISPRPRPRVSTPSPASKVNSVYDTENLDNFVIATVASCANSYVVDEHPSAAPFQETLVTQQPCMESYDTNSNHGSGAHDCVEDSGEFRENPSNGDNMASVRLHTPETNTCDVVPVAPIQPESPIKSEKSRPQTPVNNSRLARSLPPSRPQTPHLSHTSASPIPRVQSRPNTPGRNMMPKPPNSPVVASKPKTCSIPVPTRPLNNQQIPLDTVCPTVKEEDEIKSIIAAKRKEFLAMKKELDTKQQEILRTYDSLRNMTERLSKEGAAPIQIEDLVVFNVADWSAEEVAQLCRDAAESSNSKNALELLGNLNRIDENTIIELDCQITNIPSNFSDLCLQAFTARQEVIDWVKDVIEHQCSEKSEENNARLEKISQYNSQGLELYEALDTVKAHADSTVSDITQISKMAFLERSVLISVGESLVKEIARLRNDLNAHTTVIQEIKKETRVTPEPAATTNTLNDTQRQLGEERAARATLKDKLSIAETQLKQTRARVSKMDRQLREAETSIISLTATVKSLEDQNRQREISFEARARKLKESLKTGEVTNSHISQQRDTYQAKAQSLTEQLETTTAQNKSTILELHKEVKELKAALEQQIQETQGKAEKNKALEQSLLELRNAACEQQIQSTQLENEKKALEQSFMELRNAFEDYKTSHPPINNTELPTEREIDLWAELQATKDTLRMTEDEVTACKREKVRFLETLTKISETEDKVGMQQKLAAELLSKEEIIGKMQIQIRELTKNIKLNEQKVTQYEQYVRNLQAHTRAVANCQESPNGISYQDLQQEIMNLRMNLLDAVHRNDELSEVLSQKEQQLEQQDKTSRAQARIIKVREELINMLKNKETAQSKELASLQKDVEYRMKIVEEVNKQIASKAEEIQELFVTLENRQQQIHRLEKIVLALEEQQRRAQVQRTRYEEKIAALEHELSAGVHRERRFLFF